MISTKAYNKSDGRRK